VPGNPLWHKQLPSQFEHTHHFEISWWYRLIRIALSSWHQNSPFYDVTFLPRITTNTNGPHATTKTFTGKPFNPYSLELLDKHIITVSEESWLIVDVWVFSDEDYCLDGMKAKVIDTGKLTVLPGFIDVHVHCMLAPTIRDHTFWSMDTKLQMS
jgi:hypothetical protein